MSEKLFKSYVKEISEIVGAVFGVIDENCRIISCSDSSKEGRIIADITEVVSVNPQEVSVINNVSYLGVIIRNKLQYTVFIEDDSKDYKVTLELAALNIRNIKLYNEEKYDKTSLFRSIVMGNILPGDIAIRAKKLQIDQESRWVVFLIKTEKGLDIYTPDVLYSLFPDKGRNFIVIVDDKNTALIRQLRSKDGSEVIESIAKVIVGTLNTELMAKAKVSIGTVAKQIGEIGRSFKEAQTAQLVGEIFESDKTIFSYDRLGLGRLIYQLPTTLCRLFIKEVFKEGSLDKLDSETMLTIQKFFENSLNISETARQLYVHRNTLVYRLEKIKRITGIDLRQFDDAILFKVSMLVQRYLDKSS